MCETEAFHAQVWQEPQNREAGVRKDALVNQAGSFPYVAFLTFWKRHGPGKGQTPAFTEEMIHQVVTFTWKEMPVFSSILLQVLRALETGTIWGGSEACQGQSPPLATSFLLPHVSVLFSQTAAGSTPGLQALWVPMLPVFPAACSSCWQGCHLLHLQCQEEERSLRASEPLPLGGSYLTQVRHVPLSLERLSRQLEKNKLKTLLRGRYLLSLQDRKSVIPSGTDAGNRLFSLLDVGECHSRAQILFVF